MRPVKLAWNATLNFSVWELDSDSMMGLDWRTKKIRINGGRWRVPMCKIFIMCTELFVRGRGLSETQAGWVVPSQHQYTLERATFDPWQWREAPLHLHNIYTREMHPSHPSPSIKTPVKFKAQKIRNKMFFKKGFFHIHKSDGLSLSKLMGGRSIYCLKKTIQVGYIILPGCDWNVQQEKKNKM